MSSRHRVSQIMLIASCCSTLCVIHDSYPRSLFLLRLAFARLTNLQSVVNFRTNVTHNLNRCSLAVVHRIVRRRRRRDVIVHVRRVIVARVRARARARRRGRRHRRITAAAAMAAPAPARVTQTAARRR
jgi:hypothetical protein